MNNHDIQPVSHAALEPWLAGRSFDDWYADYNERGYVVFPEVMSSAECSRVRDALAPHLTQGGRNHFEGYHTNRVYALLAKAPDVFVPMVSHPLSLAFAEAELGTSCLLSALLAINLHPGETAQGWHIDDGNILLPLPRPALGVSAFWAIDDTTEDNGATEVIPRSHLWQGNERPEPIADTEDPALKALTPEQDLQPRADAVKITMPAGSLMLAKGTLTHRGGANRSTAPRLVVTPQYCPGWARQLENMLLAIPKDIAAQLPQRVQELIGYNLHGTFMGYVDGVHPRRSLSQIP